MITINMQRAGLLLKTKVHPGYYLEHKQLVLSAREG